MLKTARSIPVRRVKFDTKTYYNISIGNEIVWVHKSLVENNTIILKGNRFYLDICDAPDGSTIQYLYPGKYKLTALQSTKYLYVLDGSWIMSEHQGAFYYLIAHDNETITVHNRRESFEIKDNKIVSVERLDVYERVNEHIDEEIDLDGDF